MPPTVDTSTNSSAQSFPGHGGPPHPSSGAGWIGASPNIRESRFSSFGLAPINNAGHAAVPHHGDPVGAGKNLAQLVGDQDDAQSLAPAIPRAS